MIYNMVLSQCTSMTISVLSHSTTTSTVKESSMSYFNTNNPITLYNHFITISAGSEHLTSFLYQTSLSTPEKVYQSTQINLKLTNLILLTSRSPTSCSALSCSPRYPPRIAYFSHSLHLSEKDTK